MKNLQTLCYMFYVSPQNHNELFGSVNKTQIYDNQFPWLDREADMGWPPRPRWWLRLEYYRYKHERI
jgi:hypothetical protein